MVGQRNYTAKMERGERRRSFARALDKFKAAIKRRGSSKDVPTVATESTSQSSAKPTETAEDTSTTTPIDAADESKPIVDSSAFQPSTVDLSKPLIADDGLSSDSIDEPLLPMVTSRDNGFNSDKARVLFEKYGLKYAPREHSSEEPPNKVRRVERAVRIRVHWTCHECSGHFGRDKTCISCGHRRCEECSRAPAQRVRELLETARQMRQHEDIQVAVASRTTPAEPLAAGETVDKSATETPPETASTATLEKDDHTDEDEDGIPAQYKYVKSARPRSGEDLILRPKTQIIRRSCHKCETPFIPANKTDCDKCAHVRCTLCPRYPAKVAKWPRGSPGDEKPSEEEKRMIPAVQRVYKKPRQRVRYSCDHCQTMFADRDRCRSCGHERCKDCTRYPPRATPSTPDPAVLQTVSDRLANYGLIAQPLEMAAVAG